jgi:hypothetical protein
VLWATAGQQEQLACSGYHSQQSEHPHTHPQGARKVNGKGD